MKEGRLERKKEGGRKGDSITQNRCCYKKGILLVEGVHRMTKTLGRDMFTGTALPRKH